MMVPPRAQSLSSTEQGRSGVSLAELRRQLAHPSGLDDGCRQRLSELAQRLARIRAMGGEFSNGVEFSPHAADACETGAAVQ